MHTETTKMEREKSDAVGMGGGAYTAQASTDGCGWAHHLRLSILAA